MRIGWQAPNGSNQQMYNWVLVDDPATRAEMARIYRDGMDYHIAMSAQAREEGTAQPYAVDDRQDLIGASVFYLREHLHEVPVLLVPTIDGRMENESIFDQAGRWGSVLPAVWNFMLALRSKGMGSAWTTIHLHKEREMAELLGIPYDDVTQAGLFPVAYTIGTDFRPRAARTRSRRSTGTGGNPCRSTRRPRNATSTSCANSSVRRPRRRTSRSCSPKTACGGTASRTSTVRPSTAGATRSVNCCRRRARPELGPGQDVYDMKTMRAEDVIMLADGDYVVRQQTCRAKTVHGNDYANTYCFVFRFDDDGKIVYLTEHWNTWYAHHVLFDNFHVEPAHPLG